MQKALAALVIPAAFTWLIVALAFDAQTTWLSIVGFVVGGFMAITALFNSLIIAMMAEK